MNDMKEFEDMVSSLEGEARKIAGRASKLKERLTSEPWQTLGQRDRAQTLLLRLELLRLRIEGVVQPVG